MLCDYYVPGYKAGGPIRVLENLADLLGDDLALRVITRDRDLGDAAPYSGIRRGNWCAVGKAQVRYLSPAELRTGGLRRLLCGTPHDVLYLNSLFSPVFSIWPLSWRRLGLLPHGRVVLAPRGELSSASLRIKSYKKTPYLFLARYLHLYRDLKWHATCEREASDILALGVRLKLDRQLAVVPPTVLADISITLDNGVSRHWPEKRPNSLKVVFLSRISRIKNLPFAVSLLRDLPGNIEFNIFGPVEDADVWRDCQRLVASLPSSVQVTYRGEVPHPDVPRVLASHDLFILPTQSENFGYVIAESLGAGCPVLISDQTPWRDLAASGVGWDLQLDNREGFRQALLRCMGMTQQEHASMRRRAQQFVASRQSSDFHSRYMALLSAASAPMMSAPVTA